MKQGQTIEFAGDKWKITKVLFSTTDEKYVKFMAIPSDLYQAFTKNGNFRTDQAMFKLEMIQTPAGIAFLDSAIPEYRQEIGM